MGSSRNLESEDSDNPIFYLETPDEAVLREAYQKLKKEGFADTLAPALAAKLIADHDVLLRTIRTAPRLAAPGASSFRVSQLGNLYAIGSAFTTIGLGVSTTATLAADPALIVGGIFGSLLSGVAVGALVNIKYDAKLHHFLRRSKTRITEYNLIDSLESSGMHADSDKQQYLASANEIAEFLAKPFSLRAILEKRLAETQNASAVPDALPVMEFPSDPLNDAMQAAKSAERPNAAPGSPDPQRRRE